MERPWIKQSVLKVDYLKQFKIPFKGLRLGTHEYNWEVGKTFFEAIENTDVHDCKLSVDMILEKQERMMILSFSITGSIEVSCDRCLDLFDLPIQVREDYYVKYGESYREESERILIIPDSTYQLDVSVLIFDYITLAIPIRKVHPEDPEGNTQCNVKTLKKLENLSQKNGTDPRWDALKKLKQNKS
jgi:uncharacterized metal-binding protein YceD (DUF177 family)